MPPKPQPDLLALILDELRALRADLATPPPSPVLNVDECAAMLGASRQWVFDSAFDITAPHERCQSYHVLPGKKVAGKWKFHRDLIGQYVKGEYVRPDASPVTQMRQRRSA
jgi:hypothetical protein